MTNCTKGLEHVEKQVKDGKSALEIGSECDMVKNPERKVKYLLKLIAENKGVTYKAYVNSYPSLKLHPEKAPKNPRKKPSDKKSSDTPKPSDKNLSDKPLEETSTTYEEDEIFEVDKLTLKPDVLERLDFYKNGSTTLGKQVRTYNEVIRHALKLSGLWDNSEFAGRNQ